MTSSSTTVIEGKKKKIWKNRGIKERWDGVSTAKKGPRDGTFVRTNPRFCFLLRLTIMTTRMTHPAKVLTTLR